MCSLMLPLYLSKELHFQTIPRKGPLFPHEKEELFSIELKRQVKRKKKGLWERVQDTLEGLKLKSRKIHAKLVSVMSNYSYKELQSQMFLYVIFFSLCFPEGREFIQQTSLSQSYTYVLVGSFLLLLCSCCFQAAFMPHFDMQITEAQMLNHLPNNMTILFHSTFQNILFQFCFFKGKKALPFR